MAASAAGLMKQLKQAGQAHLLRFLDELSEAEAGQLVAQIAALDLDLVRRAHEAAVKPPALQDVQPLPPAAIVADVKENEAEWRFEALAQVAAGRVAAVVLAGGQGTRLGYDGPKGAYNAGFPSQKSIFQLQVDRLLKVRDLANNAVSAPKNTANLPLYVMTSKANDSETRSFFEKNSFFGMDPADVFFFEQGMIPAVTEADGKIIMETKSSLAMSPDGNGGLFAALERSGAMADMERRGILYTHIFAVDNPLSCPGDPLFLGCCISKKVEAGNLCVSKARWDERVGVAALRDGRFHVVEYSELTEDMAKQENGKHLAFGAANICNHFFTTEFLREKVIPGMKASHHAARKAIPCVDDPSPKAPNGIKLELFIFDAFPLADSYLALQVERERYFAPIKNATGVDSPATAKAAVTALHKSWLEKAGARLVGNGDVEVSSLVTLNGEGLDRIVSGVELTLPLYIDAASCVDLEQFGANNYRLVADLSNTDSSVNRYKVISKRPAQEVSNAAQKVLDRLSKLDMGKVTPMEALFILSELKDMATSSL